MVLHIAQPVQQLYTQTGTAGGTYTAPAGVVINAATGDIDLVASTPGTYTITYSFSNGACSNTTTASITITALPTATIAYTGSPYCATGTATVYTDRNSRWNIYFTSRCCHQCSNRKYRSGSKYSWNIYSHIQLHQWCM